MAQPADFDADTLALARQLCRAALGCPEELVSPEARLEEDLGADSFGRASLAALMEDQWGLTIPDREFLAMKTLGQMLGYCLAHRGKSAPAAPNP